MDRLSQLTEDEFEHIEEEISRTTKGRAFLRRFRRQALGAATEEIRAMLEEFRLSWRQQSQAIEAANRISVLRQELIEMAASIERARHEIAALQPADADNNKIISATSELDAIVISTERASFEILNAAEKLMELSSSFREGGAEPELCASLDNEVSAIFTACSFQDLTGQRTSKVVNALRYIEQRVNAMIGIWGASEGDHPPVDDAFADKREDSHLLHGPQMDGKGVSQSDVDAMFSFDGPPAAPEDEPPPPPAEPEEEEEDNAPRFNQADIDALMSGAPPPPPQKPAGKPQSQKDIDALFGADDPPAPPPKPAAAPAAKPKAAPAAAAPPPPKAKQDQSDIDSMFDAPAPKPKAAPAAAAAPAPKAKQNQSDIDSMFDAPAPKPKAAPAAAAPAPKAKQDQSDIDAMFDAPAPKPKAAPAAAAAPPPPAAKPKAAPAAAPATPSPLDQSAIDALFG